MGRSDAELDAIYQGHGARLVAQLYAYTQDLALAEDLVQEAFCRAVARWHRISSYDDPVGWVRRVAWNLAASDWRRGRRARALAQRHCEERVPGPSGDRVDIVRALSTLPPGLRRVVIMFYLADMSLRDIAEFESITENAVKQRLHRARAALGAVLADPESAQEIGHA